jgi:hypothetical protein
MNTDDKIRKIEDKIHDLSCRLAYLEGYIKSFNQSEPIIIIIEKDSTQKKEN